MHVLVTGGTGFIGQALLPALQAAGHAVTVLSRQPDTARVPAGVAVIRDLDGTGMAAPEAVINLAGENLGAGRWNTARKQRFLDSRVSTTEALVAAFSRWSQPPRVLLNGSAIGWYGARGDETLTEASAPGSGFAATLCRDWEAAAGAAETMGVRVACVRIGIVLGLPGGALGQMLPPFRFGLGGPLGDGRQWMSWVHRDDLVRLMQRLVEDETLRGPFNGTAPAPVRNADFARALGTALRRPAVLPMPGFALRLMVGEMADELLLQGQRVLPQRALDAGFAYRYADLNAALSQALAAGS
jgi:uncharacterized protein